MIWARDKRDKKMQRALAGDAEVKGYYEKNE